MLFNPVVFLRMLQFILEYLFEQAEMIIQADAFSRKTERRDRVEKTCCKTAKPAVSKRRFRFHFLNFTHAFSVFAKNIFQSVIYAEINQIVG